MAEHDVGTREQWQTARDELANLVAQACRGGYFLREDLGPVTASPRQALSP